MTKAAFPHTVRPLNGLHGAVNAHLTLLIHPWICCAWWLGMPCQCGGANPTSLQSNASDQLPACPQPQPSSWLSLSLFPQMLLSILHTFTQTFKAGPCTPIPMMAVCTWHPRAGLDLFVRPFSPLFLTGRQLLNTTNPPPLYPPNTFGQEVTV